jgi:hypothetical protein
MQSTALLWDVPGASRVYSVFENCSNLTIVIIGSEVKTIPAYAFYGCSGLTELIIPNLVTTIGHDAFYGCRGLTEIINYATTPQTIDMKYVNGYVFGNVNKTTCMLRVQVISVATYKAATSWKDFGNILEILLL